MERVVLFREGSTAPSDFAFGQNISPKEYSLSGFQSKAPTQSDWALESRANIGTYIETRINYLESLRGLAENWISSLRPQKPSDMVINSSKEILKEFAFYFDRAKSISVPKIVMGPMPSGGMCIELHVDRQNAMYITLTNSTEVEIEIKYNDYYSSLEAHRTSIGKKVIEKYEQLTEI